MSSPEPHGSSGFTDSESSAESLEFQEHQYTATHTSAATGEGGGYNFYTHPARTSVLDANGDLILDPTLRQGPAPAANSTEMDYAAAQGDMANVWRTTGGSLPSFSRAFDFFASEPTSATADDDRFFVPSYLKGSTYVQRLEEAYNKKLEAQKEVKRSKGNGQDISTAGLSPTPLPAGAHRGMLHTVLERAPFDDGDSLAPLPRHWNTADMWTSIEVMPNMLGLKFSGPKNHHERERDHEASAIRADHFMPPQCGIYYYEVHIISGKQDEYVTVLFQPSSLNVPTNCGTSTTIAIGFSARGASLSRPVGWEPETWGYHGDDGRCFTGQNIGRSYGPSFTTGDVIGCGVNFRDQTAFWTKNGRMLGKQLRKSVHGDIYIDV
jgi:hypothetical protein